MIISDITCDFRLPSITVKEQFLFIVKKLLVGFCGIFEIRSLDYGINRTGLLAIPAENTFSEIDVITRGSPSAIATYFCFYCNGLRWAHCLAKLTSNASLFTRRISTQRMFTSEPRRERSFFERIIQSRRLFKYVAQSDGKTWKP